MRPIKLDINFSKLEGLLFAFSVFTLSHPFFFWNSKLPNFLFIIVTIISLKNIKIKVDKNIIFSIVIFILLYLTISLRSNFSIYGAITVSLIWIIFLVDEQFLAKVYKYYLFIFSISIIPSILMYISVMFLNLDIPSHYISPMNELKDGFYREYPFLVVNESIRGFPLYRFCGYYDEPGMVGTISALLLFINGFDLRKKINIPIIIAGILSLSLFFYVMLFVYVLLFTKVKYKLMLLFALFIVLGIAYSNDFLRVTFFSRFKIENGAFKGDNRTNSSFDIWFGSFRETSNYYFGLGGNASARYNFGGSSYKDIIVNYGLVFFIIYILSFLYVSIIKSGITKNFLVFTLVFLGIIYQRPSISDYYYIFLLYSSLCFLSVKKVKIT